MGGSNTRRYRRRTRLALELTADNPVNLALSTMSQCVSWRTDRVCRDRSGMPAGSYTWDEQFRRFRFQDFSAFELRRLRRNGAVDYSAGGLLSFAQKASPCFMDQQQVQGLTLPVDVDDGRYALVVTLDPAGHLLGSDDASNRVVVVVEPSEDASKVAIVDRRYPPV